jgi:hypothetical protein
MGMGVTGRTLGAIGMGNIGAEVFRLAPPFGMRHIAYDPYVAPGEARALGVELVDLDTLLRTADFVCVMCPLNDETRGMIGARELALMQPSAYLINTARGPIVQEKALHDALVARRIAGAALDVFEVEPTPADNPILALDNVVVTPHAFCFTDECLTGLARSAFTSVLDVSQGRAPRHIVNRAALAHWGSRPVQPETRDEPYERAEAVIRERFADTQITLGHRRAHRRAADPRALEARPYPARDRAARFSGRPEHRRDRLHMRLPMRHRSRSSTRSAQRRAFHLSGPRPGSRSERDIDKDACHLAAGYVQAYPNAKVVCGDGIKFLAKFQQPIGLLYLDGWDVIPGTDYAEKHLLAYQTARPRLAATSLILIDDTDLLMGGKGKLVLPAAIRDGYELMVLGRQTMLLRAGAS